MIFVATALSVQRTLEIFVPSLAIASTSTRSRVALMRVALMKSEKKMLKKGKNLGGFPISMCLLRPVVGRRWYLKMILFPPTFSKCPVYSPSSWTYEFTADPAGTHWWHSHAATQRMDGVAGALIVRKSDHDEPHRHL